MNDVSNDLDWATVDRLSHDIAAGISQSTGVASYDRVIGVSRGGLIPAVLIAAELQVSRVESVQVRFYEGDQKLNQPMLVGPQPSAYGPGGDASRTLIIDEIVDSGATMRCLYELFPQATFTALVARGSSAEGAAAGGLQAFPCDPEGDASRVVWVAETLDTDRWILFPWSPPEDRAAGAGGGRP